MLNLCQQKFIIHHQNRKIFQNHKFSRFFFINFFHIYMCNLFIRFTAWYKYEYVNKVKKIIHKKVNAETQTLMRKFDLATQHVQFFLAYDMHNNVVFARRKCHTKIQHRWKIANAKAKTKTDRKKEPADKA